MAEDENRGPLAPERIVDPRSLPMVTAGWRGDLPHLYKEGCTYFVTFCLADAVPERLRRRRSIDDAGQPSEIAEHFDLDPDQGECILLEPRIASIIEASMLHFQGQRYALSAWCVMPNHVHVVVTPYADHALSDILHSWKSFSAHEINRALRRVGKLWEKESFDHLVRHDRAFEQFVTYTENNPVVAGLCERPADWPFSSARFRPRDE